MTLTEFKAWFEGYTEGLEGAPTKAQFDRIKERVKEISGTPISERIFVDRYVDPWRPYWDHYRTNWSSTGSSVVGGVSAGPSGAGTLTSKYSDGMHRSALVGENTSASLLSNKTAKAAAFDSHAAMYNLGKMEAAA